VQRAVSRTCTSPEPSTSTSTFPTGRSGSPTSPGASASGRKTPCSRSGRSWAARRDVDRSGGPAV